jgi:hypothetical protein
MDTLGSLIDKLTITNLKIWACEDIKRLPCSTDQEIATATKKTNILNSLRNDLIQEIDEMVLSLAKGELIMKNYQSGNTKCYKS